VPGVGGCPELPASSCSNAFAAHEALDALLPDAPSSLA
jgi:hypothetical protein